MHDERDDHPNDQTPTRVRQFDFPQQALELWHRLGNHCHREAPSSVGEITISDRIEVSLAFCRKINFCQPLKIAQVQNWRVGLVCGSLLSPTVGHE
jgi:hypothetical protein